MKNSFREQAYKESPEIAKLTDFAMMYNNKLRKLHKKYMEETGKKIDFIPFVIYMYKDGQDLVIEPELN